MIARLVGGDLDGSEYAIPGHVPPFTLLMAVDDGPVVAYHWHGVDTGPPQVLIYQDHPPWAGCPCCRSPGDGGDPWAVQPCRTCKHYSEHYTVRGRYRCPSCQGDCRPPGE